MPTPRKLPTRLVDRPRKMCCTLSPWGKRAAHPLPKHPTRLADGAWGQRASAAHSRKHSLGTARIRAHALPKLSPSPKLCLGRCLGSCAWDGAWGKRASAAHRRKGGKARLAPRESPCPTSEARCAARASPCSSPREARRAPGRRLFVRRGPIRARAPICACERACGRARWRAAAWRVEDTRAREAAEMLEVCLALIRSESSGRARGPAHRSCSLRRWRSA